MNIGYFLKWNPIVPGILIAPYAPTRRTYFCTAQLSTVTAG